MRADGTEVTPVTQEGPIVEAPVWSPDGRYLAFQEPSVGTVTLLEIVDLAVHNRIELDGACWLPVWSPDSKTFATACDSGDDTSHLVLGSADSWVSLPDYPVGYELAWLSDERLLFASNRAGTWDFYEVDVADQVPVPITDHRWPQRPSLAVSPDGKRVAFTVGEVNEVMIMEADGSGVTAASIEGSPLLQSLSWSPDGSHLGLITNITTVEADTWHWVVSVMNPDGTGWVDLMTASETCMPDPLVWSPRGDLVAFSGRENPDSPAGVYTVSHTGGELTDLAAALGLDVEVTDFNWTPDGTHLAMAVRPRVLAMEGAIEAHGWEGWRDAFGEEYFGIYVARADGSEFTQVATQGELVAFISSPG